MKAKDFLEEIDYYNTNVDGEQFEDLGIETLADILEVYHQRKLKLLGIGGVSQQRELLQYFCNLTNITHDTVDEDIEDTIHSFNEQLEMQSNVSERKIVGCEDPMVCLRGCSVHEQTCRHPVYER